jgi:FkbM family methyltransferase
MKTIDLRGRRYSRFCHTLFWFFSRLSSRRMLITTQVNDHAIDLVIAGKHEIDRAHKFNREKGLTDRIIESVQPGDLIFDIGANIGIISLAIARSCADPGVRIVSFEPEPNNFEHLRRNIELNHLEDRISAEKYAITSRNSVLKLYVREGYGDGRHSLVNSRKCKRHIEVEAYTLEHYCKLKDRHPDILKIDVEGAEGDVLAGLKGISRDQLPRDLFIEIHAMGGRDKMPDGSSIADFLRGLGYALCWDVPRRTARHQHYRISA